MASRSSAASKNPTSIIQYIMTNNVIGWRYHTMDNRVNPGSWGRVRRHVTIQKTQSFFLSDAEPWITRKAAIRTKTKHINTTVLSFPKQCLDTCYYHIH